VTLTGTNFLGNTATVEIDGTSYPATIVSDTELLFVIPDIDIGTYVFIVVNGTYGFAGAFEGTIELALTSVLPTT
jgi:hypothetical protein